jgi:hypothetical protein
MSSFNCEDGPDGIRYQAMVDTDDVIGMDPRKAFRLGAEYAGLIQDVVLYAYDANNKSGVLSKEISSDNWQRIRGVARSLRLIARFQWLDDDRIKLFVGTKEAFLAAGL